MSMISFNLGCLVIPAQVVETETHSSMKILCQNVDLVIGLMLMKCECDWKYHEGRPCPNEAADHGHVKVSPALCIPCLYLCEKERDEETDES